MTIGNSSFVAILFFLLMDLLTAQQVPPQGINYQAVAVDIEGKAVVGVDALGLPLSDKGISIRFSIELAQSDVLYQEIHFAQTDQFGLFSVTIGQGEYFGGILTAFEEIDWSLPQIQLRVELDVNGGLDFRLMSLQPFLSVPYALYAANSGSGGGVDGQSAYELWVSLGNEGTEGDFLQSLRGEQGLQGPAGPAGPEGPEGPEGVLSKGAAVGNTAYWDGNQWVVSSSNIFNAGAGVGLGTDSPHPSAKLEISSNNQGFLPSRLSIEERDAIESPANGLVVFNTTTGCLSYFFVDRWFEWCGTEGLIAGKVESLDCQNVEIVGEIVAGKFLEGVQILLPYTGGNGGLFSGRSFSSLSSSGLVLRVEKDTLKVGSGFLLFTITGFIEKGGKAQYELQIAGATCLLEIEVEETAQPPYPVGTVHCDPDDPTKVIPVLHPTTGKIWMDRNLGARRVAQAINDSDSYGDFYQWGRFSDGHQCRNSQTTTLLSSSDQLSHGDYILTPNMPFDWRSPQNANLWKGVNGINNPCPEGYRLPTEAEWEEELLTWPAQNRNGAIQSPLRLPSGGARFFADGLPMQVGIRGTYWSSSFDVSRSIFLNFGDFFAETNVFLRGEGHSVRCIQEQ